MKKWRMLLLALLLALLCGCAASEPLPDYAPEESQRLILYTSHKKEVWQPIVKEFEARTGVWVTVVEGGSNELLEQLAAKTDAPQADVMFGGGVESLESYQDLFAPYTCADADAILPQYRAKDDIWTPFSSLPLVFVYNPKLVGAEEITGWADLLRPELAGKIAFADPSVSGSSYTALVTMLCALPGETDEILQAFAENLDGKQLQSSGAVLTAVAGGQAVVGVTLEETASRSIAAGDELVMVYPADGTSCVPDGCAILKGAPHEENAKLFVDFTVSLSVQKLLQERFCRRSVRGDLESTGTLPALSQIPQVDYDVGWERRRAHEAASFPFLPAAAERGVSCRVARAAASVLGAFAADLPVPHDRRPAAERAAAAEQRLPRAEHDAGRHSLRGGKSAAGRTRHAGPRGRAGGQRQGL